jgi:uncharacterized membrane protein
MNRAAKLVAIALLCGGAMPVHVDPADATVGCLPEVLRLPLLPDHKSSALYAMNRAGWAVGTSRADKPDEATAPYATAVLWRDGEVIDLGIGGELTRHHRIRSVAVDVNEKGVIAAQRYRYVDSTWVEASSWLWAAGTTKQLEVNKQRPFAVVQGLNDRGIAVGYVSAYPAKRSARPAMWQNGHQLRLRLPQGATGRAFGINSNGLIIGRAQLPGAKRQRWFWQVDGTSGPLPDPHAYVRGVLDVDNHGRILGSAHSPQGGDRGYLWDGPQSQPRLIGNHAFATAWDMNDHGDVVGYQAGLFGLEVRAWVSDLGADSVVQLPSPKGSGGNAIATSVIRGVTWFAPQGGVSVGGYAGNGDWALNGVATIWTCAQTY